MKKVLLIVAVSASVVLLSLYGGYQYLVHNHEKKELEMKKKAEKAGAPNEEFMEQTQPIGGISYKVELGENPTQDAVIEVMHKMTHQKIRAEQKWGAIPMIPETINDVFVIVSKSHFERKEEFLAILERWKNGDFSRADEDHNYLWSYEGGTIGKAYGIMSESEEQEFIKNNFKEAGTNKD